MEAPAQSQRYPAQTTEILDQYRATWGGRISEERLLTKVLWSGEIEDFTGFDVSMVYDYIANNITYCCDDSTLAALIIQTAARLPRDVRAFVFDRCVFLSAGRMLYGMVLPGATAKPETWIILLSERMHGDDLHSFIAHEIAHAWLGHDRLSPEVPVDHETQAANLAQQWGFIGRGADARHCNAYMRR